MKRDVTITYWKLIEKFRKHPTGKAKHYIYPDYTGHESNEVVRVSNAHKVCLSYLIWLGEQHLESAEAFTKAAVQWRKEPGKFAKGRTLLERLSRVYRKSLLPKLRQLRGTSFGGINGMRTQMSQGLGIFHPEYPPERRKETGRIGGLKSATIPQLRSTKKWIVTDPKGDTFIISDRRNFCLKNNITGKSGYSFVEYKEPDKSTDLRTSEGG
jgi:hypothetical protein